MSWVAVAPELLAVSGVLFLPGLLILLCAGARGLRLWSLAVPVTFGVAGVGAVLLGIVGLPFTIWTFLILTAVAAGGAFGVRTALAGRRWAQTQLARHASPPKPHTTAAWTGPLAVAAGLTIAALTVGLRFTAGVYEPTAIAQLFDNVFHLNAVALVHATGNGSSLTLGNLTPASSAFYPAAFHDVGALILGVGVTDVSVAINVMTLVLCAVVWPLSLMLLTTRLFGERPEVFVLTGVLAGAFAAFPYRMLSFGVLYPFLAGVAMLPVIVALVAEFFGRTRVASVPAVATLTAFLATAPGIALAHPSVIVAALILASPFAVACFLAEAASPHRRPWALILGSAYVVAAAAVFLLIRPPLTSAPWTPTQSYKEAIGSIVTVSPGPTAVAWAICALMVLGFAAAARHTRTLWPVVAGFALMATIYFASAAVAREPVRDLLAAVWYRDTERIGALLAVAAVPVAVSGALALNAGARSIARRALPRLGEAALGTTAVSVVAVLLLLGTQRGPLEQAEEWIAESFGRSGYALLSPDERAVLEQVGSLVPADGVVVGNPRTGASLTPAFSDRLALAPHIYGTRTADETYLLDHWDEAGTDPLVCPVISRLNAYWALDFGEWDVQGGTRRSIGGTDRLGSDPEGVTEIARVGDAALYEATACLDQR